MIITGTGPMRKPSHPNIYDFRRLCLVLWVATTAYLGVSITRALRKD